METNLIDYLSTYCKIFNIFGVEKHSMQQPLISIIVPCYNQAQYLDECLQTVLNQTYENWECIIINDGSPDNTEEITKTWIAKDTRFKYIFQENKGVSAARNNGIENAEGEWILPLDGDDKIAERYLELASMEFEKQDIIYCEAEYFGEKAGKIISDDFDPSLILLENQLFSTSFFRKKDWQKIGGFDEMMHKGYEDWEFWLRIISDKNSKISVKKLNYTGFFYRIKKSSRNIDAMYENDLEIKNYIFRKHQSFYGQNLNNFGSLLLQNRKLKSKIIHLETILNSKRYLLINKFFNFFKI